MRDDFAVFIITHGRPDNQITLNTLKKGGYTGKLYFILDDEDETADQYRELYGAENVCIFNKDEAGKLFDLGDNQRELKKVPVYARNACWDIAKSLGLKYFVQLDDDYSSICFRYIEDKKLKRGKIKDFNSLFDAMCEFLSQKNVWCIAFGVEGDFIGGPNSKYKEKLYQNARNSFFCCVDKPFEFLGRINEDVTTPAFNNSLGRLFYTVLDVCVTLKDHNKNEGGSTDLYKETNLYWNYFYPVLWLPSAISIKAKKDGFIKHVEWDRLTPKLLSEKWKK
jgi:hypothetical protein